MGVGGLLAHADCDVVDKDGSQLGSMDRMELEHFATTYAAEPEEAQNPTALEPLTLRASAKW